MKLSKKYTSLGFTLIELLIVVTIIGILSAVALVSYRDISAKARDSKRQADLGTLRQALVLYRTEIGSYPGGNDYDTMLGNLVTGGYLSQPTPIDPRNTDEYVYVYTASGSPATGFCMCAKLEKVDSTANAGTNGSGGCSFTTSSPTFYCVNNP